MVSYTSTLIDVQAARAGRDRFAPISMLGVSPKPASRLIDVEPRTISPVFTAFMGEVRPDAGQGTAVVTCEKSVMTWHRGTDNTTSVFGGPERLATDIQNHVGPPPPSRPPV
jgi:hypothetical protein